MSAWQPHVLGHAAGVMESIAFFGPVVLVIGAMAGFVLRERRRERREDAVVLAPAHTQPEALG